MEGKLLWAGVVIAAIVLGALAAAVILDLVTTVGQGLMQIST